MKSFFRKSVYIFFVVLICSCSEPASIQDNQPSSTLSHLFEPSEEMMLLANQQCLDDSDKKQGVVEAVDPVTGMVASKAVVDC